MTWKDCNSNEIGCSNNTSMHVRGLTVKPTARKTPNSHAFSVMFDVNETNRTKKQIVMTITATKGDVLVVNLMTSNDLLSTYSSRRTS